MKHRVLIVLWLVVFCLGPLWGQCTKEQEKEFISELRNAELRRSDRKAYTRVIECLGELRSVAAINALADAIDFRAILPGEEDGMVLGMVITPIAYPAAGALAKIGEPALPRVIKLIEEHDQESHEFRMAHWILLTVFQYRGAEGVELVEKAAAGAKSELERQRLLLMVEKLRKTLQ